MDVCVLCCRGVVEIFTLSHHLFLLAGGMCRSFVPLLLGDEG